MSEFLFLHESAIRLSLFAGFLTAMIVLEAASPKRRRGVSRWARWPGNLGIIVLNTAVLRLLFAASAVEFAATMETMRWGLFSAVDLPFAVELITAFVVLDLAIYTQHVAFHAVPALWRLHRMHHADLDFDVTTGVRFHPIEILLSMAIKFAVIAALGAPALSVLLFEIVLNLAAMFNHSNLALPPALDRMLRWVIVTPDMHRVHHSILPQETHSNFGFNAPWWDYLFGTYRAQPARGHQDMTIGLPLFRDNGELRLDRMLIQPIRDDTGGFPKFARPRHD